MQITTCEVAGLPDELDGVVIAADLQGRELLPPTRRNSSAPSRTFRECRRLLGEVVAERLTLLSSRAQIPAGNRLGVIGKYAYRP